MSRRGALALVGGGALFMAVLTAGQTLGGFTRRAALLLPRGRTRGDGPNDFQVNRTAAAAAFTPTDTGARWRLTVRGPVAAVRWTAPRCWPCRSTPPSCRSPASKAGPRPRPGRGFGWRTWPGWPAYPRPSRRRSHWSDPVRSAARLCRRARCCTRTRLLALRVNGADLSPDHGFPARIIVPALPGVHNTKWVESIVFRAAANA